MINWLQNRMQKSTKVLALVLFLLCSQLQIASHFHADDDIGFEACSVCLVGQNAEFDDALLPTQACHHLNNQNRSYYQDISVQVIFDNSPIFLYLRGPPA